MKKMIAVLTLITISCQSKEKKEELISENKEPVEMEVEKGLEVATFGGGCFWCTEAIFLELEGVKKVGHSRVAIWEEDLAEIIRSYFMSIANDNFKILKEIVESQKIKPIQYNRHMPVFANTSLFM